ncbi:MAG: hypothetical protein O2779_02470 [Nanoarchaeota archaeon]|nr:hypothetical protein [Nanoarchaeota archaeon]
MDDGVFVKIDDYKSVLDIVAKVKSKIHDARSTIEQIKHLKHREDTELGAWGQKLDDIEGKMDDLDRTMFRPPT